ncbi:MAG: transaldolase family protein [Euryarchaeota archaeon]|nr:transaldolase family protein [Euryarchaeota archaeon]NDF22766.1 transaldolase family protein [Euryarchaeota archaeon]NDF37196.1 transaldolase family protein [Euryarchaeota archaeon]NDG22040.1 transaldolase family protein [Euryarchaeota archaeon]
MELILDSAVVDEVIEISNWGVLDGVTTNPSLIRKSGGDFEETIRKIAEICPGPISAEVTSLTSTEMIREGMDLKSRLPENVIIKIPCTSEGLSATKALSESGVRVNVTLIFSLSQALLSAKAGAAYISPFLGRLDDDGKDGLSLIEDIRTVWEKQGIEGCKILAASIRSTYHVEMSAKLGAHAATIPYNIFKELINHKLTVSGLEKFMSDWEAVKAEGRA